jgi:hypothetical protein
MTNWLARAHAIVEARPIKPEGAHWRWRIVFDDGRAIEVCYTPEAERREVEGHYPGAKVEPLPDEEPKRLATAEGRAELAGLVEMIYAKDTPADRAEALAHALSNPREALTCYRGLAAERT